MQRLEVLYNAEQIRRAVRNVFRSSGRRVAIVGFVGKGAESYLPKAKGIELYCWPEPGATNPDAIRKLQKLGVEVSFVDRLHAKLYWSARGGAVIASSNLSTNAYGRGNLHELGIHLPSRMVDIDRILRSVRAQPVTETSLNALKRAAATRPPPGTPSRPRRTFRDWYDAGRRRERWLLAFSNGSTPAAKRLRSVAKAEHHVRTLTNWMNCRRGAIRPDDYVLAFTSTGASATAPEWLHADYVVQMDAKERARDPGFPMQMGQVWPLARYRRPPFEIDAPFRRAARRVLGDALANGRLDYAITAPPPPSVLRRLYEAYVTHAE